MRKYIAILTSAIISISAALGQNFHREGKLGKVEQNGFYKILLTPDITTHLKEDYADVRIFDTQGNEIPYILKSETAETPQQLFREYRIEEKTHVKGCCTHLILHNPDKSKINNIRLIIKNADVRKKARLTGSDDRKEWYSVKEDIYLESVYNDRETFEVKILDFPLSDYEYYRLDIADSSTAPLNIVKAGFYDTYVEEGKYQRLPSPVISHKDSSDKNSYVTISFPSPQYIDKLKLEVKGPLYYLRPVIASIGENEKNKIWQRQVAQSELRSNSENILYLDHQKVKELYLVIQNHDNHPLQIKSAQAQELTHYLVANLEQGKEYVVKFSNPSVSYPQYDLEYFQENIPSSLSELQVHDIKGRQEKHIHVEKSFFQSPLWIWGAIIGVMILLGFMSVKMIREMKKN